MRSGGNTPHTLLKQWQLGGYRDLISIAFLFYLQSLATD